MPSVRIAAVLAAVGVAVAAPGVASAQGPVIKIKQGATSASLTLDSTVDGIVTSEKTTVTKPPPGSPPSVSFTQTVRDRATGAVQQRTYGVKLVRRFTYSTREAVDSPFDPLTDTITPDSELDYRTFDWEPFCEAFEPDPDAGIITFGTMCGLRKVRLVPNPDLESGVEERIEQASFVSLRDGNGPRSLNTRLQYATEKGVGVLRLEALLTARRTFTTPCRGTKPCPPRVTEDPAPLWVPDFRRWFINDVEGLPLFDYAGSTSPFVGLPTRDVTDLPWGVEFPGEAVRRVGQLFWP